MAGLVGGPGAEPPGRRRIFENLQKYFLRKFQIMHYFGLFFKENLKTQRYIFARLDEKQLVGESLRKIFDENSIEKLNFYLFWGNFVAKTRAFGNNISFLQQFSPVRGSG